MSTIANRQHAVKVPSDDNTPAGVLLTELIIPIIQLEAHFSRAGEAIAAAGGQTLARWLTLEMVAVQPATVAQVAHKLGLTRQSIQRIADLLEDDGLTEYADNPAHKTSRLVRLTPHGRQVLRRIQTEQRTWANAVGGKIGEVNLRHATRVVEQLTRILAGNAG